MQAFAQEPWRQELTGWMERQYPLSAKAMMSAISAVQIVKERRGFGRFIRPARGSILASPVMAAYDPDPDYFFHWLRDSAVIVDALRSLIESGEVTELEGLGHFRDFLRFSLTLSTLDGRDFLKGAGDFRAKVEPFFLQYVRPDSEFIALTGDSVLGEPRFDPDGAFDILKWSRPQHDGPALRALSVARFCASVAAKDAEALALAKQLLSRDLDFTLKRWRQPSFDIWEEELGRHYYTQLVQCEALEQGGLWIAAAGEAELGRAYRAEAHAIAVSLDDFWSEEQGFHRSRISANAACHEKDLDIATLLAVIHSGRKQGSHSVLDSRVIATVMQLEDLFAGLYRINQPPIQNRAPAMGRYRGDAYYSGGAYYFSTLGAAEFYFRAAGAAADADILEWGRHGSDICRRLGIRHFDDAHHSTLVKALFRRGDMFMATVAAFTPSSGDLSEQFDQTTGAQTSAKSLAWSHAAFISAYATRGEALRKLERTEPSA
ncbi:Glucan 1,4-alpha-glucosidase [Methylocella tundrae]|uniref:glucan 1,4-alpha-glucosidase n=1 Tax=Methylocella tundrae TaxID=227605 RepID=A0A8B6M7J2_METTU|nr:glycoside hydrolase family 15 protein [Methylocella tundrae]VTZ50850.1 Glucan 1,4-alpha-glucosidase [Methylocella tundrae]